MNLDQLKAHFPKSEVHWRAQTLTRNGDKALALAYIDARHVMDRLDEVCGPNNWQTRHTETAKGRILCEIGIRCGDEWIWKSDGAGNTDVEGEKGAISDALKRAAVSWGVGRYLYEMPQTWVPCETYEANGKKRWSKWKVDPWSCVRDGPIEYKPKEVEVSADRLHLALENIASADSMDALSVVWSSYRDLQSVSEFVEAKDERKHDLSVKGAA